MQHTHFCYFVGGVLNRPLVAENFSGLDAAAYVFIDGMVVVMVGLFCSS